MLPAAASIEKEGSVVNSGRWMQWRYEAVSPAGRRQTRSWTSWTASCDAVKAAYSKGGSEAGVFPDPILNELDWDYGGKRWPRRPASRIAKEINGQLRRRRRRPRQGEKIAKAGTQSAGLHSSCGTTAPRPAGNWLYCGSYTEAGNMAARRDADRCRATAYRSASELGLGVAHSTAASSTTVARWITRASPISPRKWVIRWNADVEERGRATCPTVACRPEGRRSSCCPAASPSSSRPDLVDGPLPRALRACREPGRESFLLPARAIPRASRSGARQLSSTGSAPP